MAEDAKSIKAFMVKEGVVKSEDELDWLTDEYISNRVEKEKLDIGVMDGQALNFIDYGNHFYITGSQWHWDSGDNVPGGNLACGRNNSWVYTVRPGDSYGTRGNCGSYSWYELNIYH